MYAALPFVIRADGYRHILGVANNGTALSHAQESIRGKALNVLPAARSAPRVAHTVCSAQQQERPQLASVLAAAALAAAVSLGSVEAAQVGQPPQTCRPMSAANPIAPTSCARVHRPAGRSWTRNGTKSTQHLNLDMGIGCRPTSAG